MLKKILFLLTFTLLSFYTVKLAQSAITNSSRVIPYQGRLTDSSGNNVADGTYSMTFKIYTVSTGGSASFTETNSSVSVSSGLFSVLLGSLSANGVNLDFANPPYYLGITVASNSEMSPRIQLGFAPLAHNSQYLDGTPLSSFFLNTGGTISGATTVSIDNSTTNDITDVTTFTHTTTGTSTGSSDSYTKLLLHLDGSNGSTTITDSSSSPHTMSTGGNAQISTAQSKFGGSGAIFDGSGDSITTADSEDWNFGTGDFTIDFWAYPTVRTCGNYQMMMTQGSGSFYFGPGNACGDGANYFRYYNYNLSLSLQDASQLALNTWTHVAVVRSGNTWTLYKNGVISASTTNTGAAGNFTGSLTIGYNAGDDFQGYLDEIRVSKGIARWTTSFTPPALAYNNYGSTGIGTGLLFKSEDGSGNVENVGRIGGILTNVTDGSESSSITFDTRTSGGSLTRRMRLDDLGNLTISGSLTQGGSPDIAENIIVTDDSIGAGDVIMIDESYKPANVFDIYNRVAAKKSDIPYSSKLLGVISTSPGSLLNSSRNINSNERPLTLSGRVPVKIDPKSEPISSGDFLTSSENPGFAKKATRSGYIIGRALENWKPGGEDKILIFVNFTFADIGDTIDQLRQIVCLDHPENKLCL